LNYDSKTTTDIVVVIYLKKLYPPLYPKLALHISRQLTPHITVNKLTMRQVSEEFLIGALTISKINTLSIFPEVSCPS
jgi:hypothetical protein